VAFPKNGDVFVLEPAYSKQSQEIKLEAATPCSEPVQWYADGAALTADGAAAWWPLAAGPHRVWFTQNCGGKTITAKAVKFRVIGYGEPVPNADPPEP